MVKSSQLEYEDTVYWLMWLKVVTDILKLRYLPKMDEKGTQQLQNENCAATESRITKDSKNRHTRKSQRKSKAKFTGVYCDVSQVNYTIESVTESSKRIFL